VSARGGDHPFRLQQAAGLHQLQVRDVTPVGDRGDVGERHAGLVGGDGERRPLVDEPEPLRVLGGHRLLDEFHVAIGEPLALPDRLAGRPRLVRVDPEPGVGRGLADRVDQLAVSVGPELDLEDRVAGIDRGLGLLTDALRLVESDRVGGRGRGRGSSPQRRWRGRRAASRRGRGPRSRRRRGRRGCR